MEQSHSQRLQKQETDHASAVQALNDARDQQLVKLRAEMEAQADNVRHVNAFVCVCMYECVCRNKKPIMQMQCKP